MDLRHRFPDAFDALQDLFGAQEVENKRRRLNEIFNVCEEAWERNISKFMESEVRYLLIAEAPPWTDEGEAVRYFYKTLDGQWVAGVLKTFFERRPSSIDRCLKRLGQRGFLLIDSLPFAMNYSVRKRLRQSHKYLNLVHSCSDYLLSKIRNKNIVWTDDVRVALGVRWNGLQLTKTFPRGLELPTGQALELKEEVIAVGKNYYPGPLQLRDVWGI